MAKKPEISRKELAALRTLAPDEVIERYGGALDNIPMGIWECLDERQVEGIVGMYMERKVCFSTDGKGKGKGRPRQAPTLAPFPAGEPDMTWTSDQLQAYIDHYEHQPSAPKPEKLKQAKLKSQPSIESDTRTVRVVRRTDNRARNHSSKRGKA